MRKPAQYDDRFGINILALDGGGIYGLTEAQLLKKLCLSCEWFLSGEDEPIFAGCSAGALNALLLAQEKRPREAVLGGKLEAFWKESGTFSNSDPTKAYLSYFGLTPWFSDTDFLDLLEQYFGGKKLSDLEHTVIVTAYSWNGQKPDFKESNTSLPWPMSVFAAAAASKAKTTQADDNWGPVCFHNIPVPGEMRARLKCDDRRMLGEDYRVVDVGYSAAAPPGYRRIRGGVGDAGAFNANPAITAFALGQRLRVYLKGFDKFAEKIPLVVHQHGGTTNDALRVEQQFEAISAGDKLLELDNVAILSIGAGQAESAYWLTDVDLGSSAFGAIPTNPARGAWLPPTAYTLDPAAEDADLIGQHLFGDQYHRLDPAVMRMPTMVAVTGCRFPWLLHQYIQQIETAVNYPEVCRDVDGALDFVNIQWKLPKGFDQYVHELSTGANERAILQGQMAFWYLINAARTTDAGLLTKIMGLTQDPAAAALEAIMWDGIVTDNERTPLQIFVAPKAPATGDVPRILREIRRLVDQAIKLSFLGARRPALDRLKTGIDDRLCSALADKLGIRPEQLQKSLDVLPELVLTFYADDAASASQNLRAAVAGGDRPIMARLLDNLARRLGMVPKNPEAQRSLFEAPPLPEVFQDPSFLATVKELWRGPVAELNTSPTA